MQPKVQILIQCDHCDGAAYLPDREDISNEGERYQRYKPCPACFSSGKQTQWITLDQFLTILNESKCAHEHTSYQGGYHFTQGEVWDDLTEVCDDCGANLDKQTLP